MSNRLVKTIHGFTQYNSARIYKNTELGEYVVRFNKENKHLVGADYFTQDKLDAINTAYVVLNQIEQQYKEGKS